MGGASLGVVVERARRQEAAIRLVEHTGTRVFFDFECDRHGNLLPFNERSLAVPPGPTWLRRMLGERAFSRVVRVEGFCRNAAPHLARFSHLRAACWPEPGLDDKSLFQLSQLPRLETLALVDMSGVGQPSVTDVTLEHLARRSVLRRLAINGGDITDRGVRHLAELQSLEELELTDARITDESLRVIGKLKNIDTLYIGGNQGITDQGLAHLAGLQSLRTLGLRNSSISDEGVRTLATVQSLEWVDLGETDVTWAGVFALRKRKVQVVVR